MKPPETVRKFLGVVNKRVGSVRKWEAGLKAVRPSPGGGFKSGEGSSSPVGVTKAVKRGGRIIMNMLQEEQPHGKIYNALDTYFPESESQLHPKATAQDLELVQTAQENFRVLVLGLLSDRRHQEKYVQEHLENDYGDSFLQVVEELFNDYLWQLEQTLPEPHFQQLLEAASIQGSSQPPQPSASLLSQYLAAVGSQHARCPELSPSPSQSGSPCQSEEDSLGVSQPFSPQPGRGRRENCVSCISEENSQGHHSVNWQADASGDLVPDTESEGSSSPFKGEYQGTHHCTLIPTFQEHLRDSRSQYASSPMRLTSPAV
ncbi:TERF1-interacting nuclear factor 2 [Python bivittatus]|uniref:TERF1-interacting nuclear factor 2 n=1 Tax=Python bivittatus TaxID=176946 RepID=A0A9F2RBM2_PYTBI|nr:TERF1-interacting nuclear factor 2 [Python bivittatus]